jgi:hypothetical protein
MTDKINDANWRAVEGSGMRFVVCWSCKEHLASRKKGGWELPWGYRTKGRRHPNRMPWYGWSESAVRRVHGRNDPRKSAPDAWADQRIRPPLVVTCKCGAENLVSLTPPATSL